MSGVKNAGETPRKARSGRPFEPGNAGRPKGARNRRTVLVEQLIEADAEDIAKALIASAKAGDATALRLCIERLAPARKGRPVSIDLPPVEKPADIVRALGAAVEAMGRGEISPDEAAAIAGVLEAQRRAVETHELAERVAVLEGNAGKR